MLNECMQYEMIIYSCFLLFNIFITQAMENSPEIFKPTIRRNISKTVHINNVNTKINNVNKEFNEYILDSQSQITTENFNDKYSVEQKDLLQENYSGVSLELFTDFIQNVVEILSKYNDSDLYHFLTTVINEVKTHELSESHRLSRFISNKFKNMPAITIRKQLSTIAGKIENEKYDENQRKVADYINSFYGEEYTEKFKLFLRNIEEYRLKRKNMNLETIVRDGVKSIIFDRYRKVHHDTRQTFISSLHRYLNYFVKPSTTFVTRNEGNENYKNDNHVVTKKSRKKHTEVSKELNANNDPYSYSDVTNNIRKQIYHSVFIDIETLTPHPIRRAQVSPKSTYHTPIKGAVALNELAVTDQFLLTTESYPGQENEMFVPIKNSTKLSRSLSVGDSFKNKLAFRRKPIISAKSLAISARNRNKSKSFDIKRKVLNQLQQLENEIGVVKAQIKNDTEIIQNLQKQILEKDKKRAEIIKEKRNILLRTNELKDDLTQNNVTARNDSRFGKDYLGKLSKSFNKDKIIKNKLSDITDNGSFKNNANNSNIFIESKYYTEYDKSNKNSSIDEYDLIPTEPTYTPGIFDLHEDLETFERFDGEFDWEKFITSNLHINLIKEKAKEQEQQNFRRMNGENLNYTGDITTPTYFSDIPEDVTPITDNLLHDYFVEPANNRHKKIILAPFDTNENKILVPRPEDKIIMPVRDGFSSLENEKLKYLEKNKKPEPEYDTYDYNVRFNSFNKRTFVPDIIINGRRNMPIPTSTLDPILDDFVIRDLDKAIEL